MITRIIMKFNNRIIAFVVSFLVALSINAQESKFTNHTVEKGQTLYSISKMYNTTVEEIRTLNPECGNGLSVGQTLRIAANSANSNKSSIIAKNNGGNIYHTIQSGETLYRLSRIYEVTTQEICDANPGLSTSNFRVGEVVIIPNQNTLVKNNHTELPVAESNDEEECL